LIDNRYNCLAAKAIQGHLRPILSIGNSLSKNILVLPTVFFSVGINNERFLNIFSQRVTIAQELFVA